jgi:hypothetical protein
MRRPCSGLLPALVLAFFLVAVAAASAGGSGCVWASPYPEHLLIQDVLERRVAGDLSSLFEAAAGLADAGRTQQAAAAAARDEAQSPLCLAAAGDCRVCWTLAGSAESGSATAAAELAPCATREDYGPAAGDLSLLRAEHAADWSTDESGTTSVTVDGFRDFSVTVAQDGESTTLDPSFELTLLGARIDAGGGLASANLELRYPRYEGGELRLVASADAGSVVGTISRDDGAECSISGAPSDVEVRCDLQ